MPLSSMVSALALLAAQPGAASAGAPFDRTSPPPAPDYGLPSAWAAWPGSQSVASQVAPGASAAATRSEADIFYVNPTTDRSLVNWNQDIRDAEVNAWTDASVVARQASIFNACCRVIAPRYRQATRRAFSDLQGDGAKAFALAYGDVERAFDHYLRVENRGRPFILVGHSQGASHIAKLLERRLDGTPLQRRLIAAYVIGFTLSEGTFGRTYKHLRPCQQPTETGCVIGWNAVMSGTDLAVATAPAEKAYVSRFGAQEGKTLLCINPLTFDRRRPAASKQASKGAAPGEPGLGALRPLRPRSVAARCERGLLVVEPQPDLELEPLPGGIMHYHDLGLFYADIRANAVARVRAYSKKRRAPR